MDAAALERKINSLETSLASLEVWLAVVTGLVVLGLFLEYWHEIPECIAELRKERRWLWKPVCIIAGAVFITLGVAGELVVQSVASGKETELRIANDGIFAALNKEAGDARRAASEADLRRVELEVRLVALFGPRKLTKDQSARITRRLSEFSGAKVDVYAFGVGNPWNKSESEDSINLAKSIMGALENAHMDVAGWVLGSCQTAGASNVVIDAPGGSPYTVAIASEIMNALAPEVETFPEVESNGLYSICEDKKSLNPSRPNNRTSDAPIIVAVGRKIPSMPSPEALGIERKN